jgi:hypothetical protein
VNREEKFRMVMVKWTEELGEGVAKVMVMWRW